VALVRPTRARRPPNVRLPRDLATLPGAGEKDGPKVDIEVYAFLTTTPNKLVATINHERMPVLLTREEEFDAWLNGAPHLAFALAREYPPDQMRIVQEGFKKQIYLPLRA
jgi:putative SOS response-associated peptidase YedK